MNESHKQQIKKNQKESVTMDCSHRYITGATSHATILSGTPESGSPIWIRAGDILMTTGVANQSCPSRYGRRLSV